MMLRYALPALAATLLGAAPAYAAPDPLIAPEALRADLRLAIETIERWHPDLDHSVDRARLAQRVREIERSLDHPMRREEAWAAFARLNPVLADGHLLIGWPDWRGESRREVAADAGFFPFEVTIDADGTLRIVAALGGAPTPLAGTTIRRINGRDAKALVRRALARAHGDTPAFRRALVAQRWWLYHRLLEGTTDTYEFVLDGTPRRNHRTAASRGVLPSALQGDEDFERLFACELRPDGAAILRIGVFYWPDKDRFLAFTRDCFARLQAAGTQRLVIDIRGNGGGNDDIWIDGIMPYIADRPYRTGSHYVKRVLEPDPEEGEVVGEIVAGTIDTIRKPPEDQPLRFDGSVYVLIGPLTYSSAVLFANVVQDYGFAIVAGEGGAARSRQTGGVQTMTLPATGLTLAYPRFVLSRPSGISEPPLLTPDLPLSPNPLDMSRQIDALLAMPTAVPAMNDRSSSR